MSIKKRRFWMTWIKRTLFAAILGGMLLMASGVALFTYYASTLPRPEKISEIVVPHSTEIYDRTGEVLLYEVRGDEKRIEVALEDMPDHLLSAVVHAEDASFYDHRGIDLPGIGRAVIANIREAGLVQGGSTITQQLARSAFLTRERTFTRKIKELVFTIDLELNYEKDEILGFYLNQVPFGSNVYGIGAASEYYFGKEASELTLKESTTLSAIIRAPSFYSPYLTDNGARREALVATILDSMAEDGDITQERADAAKEEELVLRERGSEMRAPHFVLDVLDSLEREYGDDHLRERGMRVITSLDWELQQEADEAVQEYTERNKLFNAFNAGVVAMDPNTGEILAMVGSRDWHGDPEPEGCTPGSTCQFDPMVNVTTTEQGRQPGSAFKPIVYATALENGMSEDTILIDEETNFGVWGGEAYIPRNYDGRFRGPVTARESLAQSLNVTSVKVLMEYAGIEESIQQAHAMGLDTLGDASQYGPALVLGAGEVRLVDMVAAYGTFASEGRYARPLSIIRVERIDGELIRSYENTGRVVLSQGAARTINSILSDNDARAPIFGYNSRLNIPGVSVKTGSTQSFRDSWTIGYNKNVVVGVWAGNNNNDPMWQGQGADVAGPIWRSIMLEAI